MLKWLQALGLDRVARQFLVLVMRAALRKLRVPR